MLRDQTPSTSRGNRANLRRIVHLCVILFAALTLCGVISAEMPELYRLQDDTSNDYMHTFQRLSDSRHAKPSDSDEGTPIARPHPSQQQRNAKPKVSQPEFVGAGSSRSVVDLLHFLSVQRT
jgi:hypothetical protein